MHLLAARFGTFVASRSVFRAERRASPSLGPPTESDGAYEDVKEDEGAIYVCQNGEGIAAAAASVVDVHSTFLKSRLSVLVRGVVRRPSIAIAKAGRREEEGRPRKFRKHDRQREGRGRGPRRGKERERKSGGRGRVDGPDAAAVGGRKEAGKQARSASVQGCSLHPTDRPTALGSAWARLRGGRGEAERAGQAGRAPAAAGPRSGECRCRPFLSFSPLFRVLTSVAALSPPPLFLSSGLQPGAIPVSGNVGNFVQP